MIKNIIYYTRKMASILWIVIFALACNDDFLNKPPLDSINSGDVFNDKEFVQANLYNLIGDLPGALYGGSAGYGRSYMLASITDEARSKSGWVPSNRVIIKGAITPGNAPGLETWGSNYSTIRKANDILKGLETSPLDKDFITLIAAQSRFLRARVYFELARRYGGVPLVIEAQELADNPADLFVPRSTQQEVYTFISSELSEIASQLPNLSDTQSGGISKQAAIALNARTALYAERWSDAATISNQLISGSDNDGLELYKPNPTTPEEAFTNLTELFISHGGNIETILEKQYLAEVRTHRWGKGNWPVRWRSDNGGQTDPTQEIVDAFEMQNTGLPIADATSGYNPDAPYTGRDPRFYTSIYYHGAPGPEGIAPRTGEPYIDMEWDNFNEGPGDIKDGNASITGYLVRKFVDQGDGFGPVDSDISYQDIRFSEVLLIYAEAENESNGPTAGVYNAINRIRNRAAMPNLTTGFTKEEMRSAIRQERKVELIFENHRYFDLIRWGIAEDVLDGYQPKGVRIERKSGAPTKADMPQLFDQSQLTFSYFDVGGRNQIFPASNNLLPIPQGEIDKFPTLLHQNPGY